MPSRKSLSLSPAPRVLEAVLEALLDAVLEAVRVLEAIEMNKLKRDEGAIIRDCVEVTIS